MSEKVRKISAESAFVAPEDEEPTFREWVTAKLNVIFIKNIPLESIKDLPTNYMYTFGLFTYMMSVSCFVYFILTGFREQMQKKYMSLEAPSDSYCDSVSKTVDSYFYADFTGKWNGEDGFQYSNALYQLNLNKFKQTESEYTQMMEYVGIQIELIGAEAYDMDLSENMVYWMAWEIELPNADSVNTLHMTGTPEVVFDRDHIFGLIANQNGECLATRETGFDKANALFTLKYDIPSFAVDPICNTTASPLEMGYDPAYDFYDFTINIDVRTFIIAFAVNTQVLAYDSLEEIAGTGERYDVNEYVEIRLSERFYNRYPGHAPVECVSIGSQHVCGLRLGETFAIPVFNHFGTNAGFPQSCNCSLGFGDVDYCNVFDFMIGLVYYNIESDVAGAFNRTANMLASLELAFKYDDPKELSRLSYNASYAAAMFDELIDPEWRRKAYSFCYSELYNATCSLIMFNPYDEIAVTASEFYYQVKEGACNDSFTIANEFWRRIENKPPTDLIEAFNECSVKWYVAIFSSTGIAAGNAATFVPFLMLGLLPLVYAYLQIMGKLPPKDEYSPHELEAASKALALTILRIRDGKIRDIKADGVLRQFVKELIQSAKAEGGYPDSDDDSDDEETEKNGHQKGTANTSDAKPIRGKYRSEIFIKDSEKKNGTGVKAEGPKPTSSPLWSLFGTAEEAPSPADKRTAAARHSAVKNGELVILNDYEIVSKRLSFGARRPSTASSVREAQKVVQEVKMIMNKAWEVRTLDGGGSVFRTAQNRSANFKLIDLRRLVAEDAGEDHAAFLFSELLGVLVMQGSMTLCCDLSEFRNTYLSRLAYEIGGRIYTGQEMDEIANNQIAVMSRGVDAVHVKGSMLSL